MAAPRVLLVDDEEDIIWGLSRALTKAGYSVLSAPSADAALSKLQTEPVDILITDIKMPGMSGLDLILEARKRYSGIKAVVMTARGSEDLQRETMERGAVEYIEKPFDLDMFLKIVARAKEEGFRGVVRDLKLVDILQILSLEKSTAAVEVSTPGGTGRIYFADGGVVHAEFGKTEGEEAFCKILDLEGGSFSLKRGMSTEKRTINKSFDNLMLAAFAAKDESAAREAGEAPVDRGFDLDSWSLSEAIGVVEEPPELVIPEDVKKALSDEITGLMAEGIEGGAIWDQEGRELVSVGKIAPMSQLAVAATEAAQTLGKGGLLEVFLAMSGGNCVLRQLGGGRFTVALVADPKVNPGMLRVNLVKAAVRLEKLLSDIGT